MQSASPPATTARYAATESKESRREDEELRAQNTLGRWAAAPGSQPFSRDSAWLAPQ